MPHHCRFKGKSTDDNDQIAVAVPDLADARCTGPFSERGCSVNIQNGDLTLDTVVVGDEGPYVCRKTFKGSTTTYPLRPINDSIPYRVRQLNANGELSSKIDP